ncbi:MAG: indole-3-glycerol phosphate synthase TrpC [Cyclobacteriaceae bacterium]|nr:indole-3-glycerol phosphate synthase TrpC [Cyclobacteriaceae bacterium]
MDILYKIIANKEKEVAERKSLYPTKLLEKSIYFPSQPVSLRKYLLREDKVGIIAEIKRKSPSKGMIHEYVSIEQTSISYMQGGASAISILTDTEFFGGKNEDLTTARKFNYCPILRKDFTIDEYQIVEAKSIGADAILLIAAVLSPKRLNELALFARSFGLEVLMEVHNEEELNSHLNDNVDVVGVNNRNLKTFEVNIETSIGLAESIPDQFVKISESGISKPETVIKLKKHGFQGFLIGEYFMSHGRPGAACAEFIQKIQKEL